MFRIVLRLKEPPKQSQTSSQVINVDTIAEDVTAMIQDAIQGFSGLLNKFKSNKNKTQNTITTQTINHTTMQFQNAYFTQNNDININNNDEKKENQNDINEAVSTISSSEQTQAFKRIVQCFEEKSKIKLDEHKILENVIKQNVNSKQAIKQQLNIIINNRKNKMQIEFNKQIQQMKENNEQTNILWEKTQLNTLKHYNNHKSIQQKIDKARIDGYNFQKEQMERFKIAYNKQQQSIDELHNSQNCELSSCDNAKIWHEKFKTYEFKQEKISAVKQMIKSKIQSTKVKITLAKYVKNTSLAENLRKEAIICDKEITKIAKLAGETILVDMVDRDVDESAENHGDEKSNNEENTKYLSFDLRLDDNYSNFSTEKNKTLKNNFAKLIGIETKYVEFICSRAGSINVTYQIPFDVIRTVMHGNDDIITTITSDIYTNSASLRKEIDDAMSYVETNMQYGVNRKTFYDAQKCVAILVSHRSKNKESNISDNQFLRSSKAAKDFHDAMMDPTWDKEYAKEKTYWEGINLDGHDRGPWPYFCPLGWKRFSYKIDNFDKRFKGWSVCYHGSNNAVIGSIMSHGIMGAYCDDTYFSPYIEFSAHPRFATPKKMKNGKYVQMIFQCRINPAAFYVYQTINPEIYDYNTPVDIYGNWKDNHDLEWVLPGNGKGKYQLTAIMMRICDDPAKLKSSHWWIQKIKDGSDMKGGNWRL